MLSRVGGSGTGIHLLYVLIVCVLSITIDGTYFSPGETFPINIEAAVGDDFNITCYMNPKSFAGQNSEALYFVNGRSGEVMSSANLHIINSTTVVYMVRNASEQQMVYRCNCGKNAIMETKVSVGTPPQPITNFTCYSYDFEYMVCSFRKPHNYILTQYNVTFYMDSAEYNYQPKCKYDDESVIVCNISLATNYHPRMEHYHYVINAKNSLGQLLPTHFDINNWDIMIPAKPGDNLRIDQLTDNKLSLVWRMPKWDDFRPKGLKWEILVKPDNFSLLNYSDDVTPERDHGLLRLHLLYLPYAHWNYQLQIRVRVRSSHAIWSQPLTYRFRTAARRPDRPPRISPSSFYIDSMETYITIYWEELLPFEHNGDNFTYSISNINRNKTSILMKSSPVSQEINLATFVWNKQSQYEFEIRSSNQIGQSLDASYLVIPALLSKRNIKEYTPNSIHNVYHAENRTYTLTWVKPVETKDLLHYTVYWCYPKRALPNECKGSIHFEEVGIDQLNFTTVPQDALYEQILNLAVSADYKGFTTGLHWTDCTMDENSDLVKMDPEIYATSSTAIKIHWSVGRVCTSILNGFKLSYCPVQENATIEQHHPIACLDDSPHITKTLPKDLKKYEIEDLQPFTKYKLQMYMYSRLKTGKQSDIQLVRTQEGRPSPPREVHIVDITNNSAVVNWLPPTQPNGVLRKYIIILNSERYEMNSTTIPLSYKAKDLDSFSTYRVFVLAQTVDVSLPSNGVTFTTLVGYPSPPVHAVSLSNDSLIQWSRPTKPNGKIDFYEVSIIQMRNEEIVRRHLSRVLGGETSCAFKEPTCIGHEYKTTVEVRAVNVAIVNSQLIGNHQQLTKNEDDDDDIAEASAADNGDLECKGLRIGYQSSSLKYNLAAALGYPPTTELLLYRSPWQSAATYACSAVRYGRFTTIFLSIIVISLGILFAAYMAHKQYNKMANINCILPATLDKYFCKEGPTAVLFTQNHCSPTNKTKIQTAANAEDQWHHLQNAADYNIQDSEQRYLLDCLLTQEPVVSDLAGDVRNDVRCEDGVLSESLENLRNSCNSSEHVVDDADDGEQPTNVFQSSNQTNALPGYVAIPSKEEPIPAKSLDYISLVAEDDNYKGTADGDIKAVASGVCLNAGGYVTVQNLSLLTNAILTSGANVAAPSTEYVQCNDLGKLSGTAALLAPAARANLAEIGGDCGDKACNNDDLLKPSNDRGGLIKDSAAIINCCLDDNVVSGAAAATSDTTGVPGIGLNSTGICGYVTQHDLNIFAKQQY